MVLEDVPYSNPSEPTTSSDFNDPSDPAFQSQQNIPLTPFVPTPASIAAIKSRIPFEALPRITRFPYLWSRSISSDAAHTNDLVGRIVKLQLLVSRPLSTPEIEAIGTNYVRGVQVGSYTFEACQLVAVLLLQRRRSSYALPFFDLAKIKGFEPKRFAGLVGDTARKAWELSTAGMWILAGSVVGSIMSSIVGKMYEASNTTRDPRLKDVVGSMHEAFMNQYGKNGRNKYDGSGGRDRTSVLGALEARGIQQKDAGQIQNVEDRNFTQDYAKAIPRSTSRTARQVSHTVAADDNDDMSPTGGMFFDDVVSNSNSNDVEQSKQVNDRINKRERHKNRIVKSTSEHYNHNDRHDHDREDQIGPRFDDPSKDTASSVGGSSWDRIRQEAAAKSSRS